MQGQNTPGDLVSIVVLIGALSSTIIGIFQYMVSFQKRSIKDLRSSNDRYYTLVGKCQKLSLRIEDLEQENQELQEEKEKLEEARRTAIKQRDKAVNIATVVYRRWKDCESENPPQKPNLTDETI